MGRMIIRTVNANFKERAILISFCIPFYTISRVFFTNGIKARLPAIPTPKEPRYNVSKSNERNKQKPSQTDFFQVIHRLPLRTSTFEGPGLVWVSKSTKHITPTRHCHSVISHNLRRRATFNLLAFILTFSLVLARPTHQHRQLLVQIAPDLCRRGQEPTRPVTHRSPLRRSLLACVLTPKRRV